MRRQIRIQSLHGSIGPVRKANAGRGGGTGRGGEKTGEPEEAASAEGERGDPPRRRGEEKEKAKREGSEGSRDFDLCDLTRQVKNPRSKTPAQRRRRGRKEKAKKERAEREEGRAQL